MVEDVTRVEKRQMYKDGKLTPYGRRMAKFYDDALPPEKVDEWGFLLTRREREAFRREANALALMRDSIFTNLTSNLTSFDKKTWRIFTMIRLCRKWYN